MKKMNLLLLVTIFASSNLFCGLFEGVGDAVSNVGEATGAAVVGAGNLAGDVVEGTAEVAGDIVETPGRVIKERRNILDEDILNEEYPADDFLLEENLDNEAVIE